VRRLAHQPDPDLSTRCPPPLADLAQATRTSAPSGPRALSAPERQALLDVLYSERSADCAPRTVYARLLDEGVYLASVRTMYRLLAGEGQWRGAISVCTLPTSNLSCWRCSPTRSGAETSPSFKVRGFKVGLSSDTPSSGETSSELLDVI
jgi:hypothetical protein